MKKTKYSIIIGILVILAIAIYSLSSSNFKTKEELVESFVYDMVDFSSRDRFFFKNYHETREMHFKKYFIEPEENPFMTFDMFLTTSYNYDEQGHFELIMNDYEVNFSYYENDPLWVAYVTIEYEVKYSPERSYNKDLRIALVVFEEKSSYYIRTVQFNY